MDLRNCVEKFIIVDGYKFTLDEKTGYYRCDKLRKRLHQYIWMRENGKIPKGCHIHHKDHNKKNNSLENLELIDGKKHMKLHTDEKMNDNKHLEWLRENINKNARPKAIEWHKSKEGLEWHKKHYEEHGHKLHQEGNFVCDCCKKEFKAIKNGVNRFCSNRCKSKWRRDEGLDDVERVCANCKRVFKVNKYSKTSFCSRSCTMIARHKKK